MKKLLTLLTILISFTSFSQIQKPITKGNFIIDGGASFSFSKSISKMGTSVAKNSTYDLSVYPTCAYFIIDNLAIGLSIPIDYGGSKDNKSYSLGLGPIIKYYFINGPFLKMSLLYSYAKGTGSYAQSSKYFYIIPGAGFAFFINPKVSIEPSLNYIFTYNTSDAFSEAYSYRSNKIELELGITIFM